MKMNVVASSLTTLSDCENILNSLEWVHLIILGVKLIFVQYWKEVFELVKELEGF